MISTDGLLYAILSLGRQSGPTPWETCAALLPEAADKAIVAIAPRGSYVVRRLADRLDPNRLFFHTPRECRADQAGSPFVLGKHNRDGCPVDAIAWPPIPALFRQRTRRLDTIYASGHTIGLLVIDCPSSAAEVLAGATQVLREHRPIVVLDFSSVRFADCLGLWERCQALLGPSYAWYDGMLLPCQDEARRIEAILGLAVRVVCALPTGQPALAEQHKPHAAIPLDLANLSTLAQQGWRHRLPADDQRCLGSSVHFDSDLPSHNLYPAETDGRAWWRWTGPGPRSDFSMPVPGPGRWVVGFDVINAGNVTNSADIRVYTKTERLELQSFNAEKMTFGPLTIDAGTAANVMKLQIVTPPTRRASQDDPRRIGISIARCALEPA